MNTSFFENKDTIYWQLVMLNLLFYVERIESNYSLSNSLHTQKNVVCIINNQSYSLHHTHIFT